MPTDPDDVARLLVLVQDATRMQREVELLCDIRHQLRRLTIHQLEEVQRVVAFIQRRDRAKEDGTLRVIPHEDNS